MSSALVTNNGGIPLRSHAGNRGNRGSDEDDSCLLQCYRKLRILTQETISLREFQRRNADEVRVNLPRMYGLRLIVLLAYENDGDYP